MNSKKQMFKEMMVRNKQKLGVVVGSAVVALPVISHASGTDPTADSVSTAMDTIKTTALTVLGSVAAVAIVLFGGIYAWRYGKKVFNVISK